MTTMTVLDSTGSTVAVEKPLTPGRAAATASRPVALSNEDNATIGALTETAPATDTASSGLNGRLQRIAQRLTSLIAQLPATLGIKTAANSLSVTVASDDALLAVNGAVGDAAWSGGSGSHTALLKAIAGAALDITTPSPVKIDQTTDGTTNRVNAVPGSTAYALIPAPSAYRVATSAASTNAANVKSSAGCIKGIQGVNHAAATVYIHFYDMITSPTVGTSTIRKTLEVPASAAFAFDFGTGVGFATGISISMTKGSSADTDTTVLASGDITSLNVDYH